VQNMCHYATRHAACGSQPPLKKERGGEWAWLLSTLEHGGGCAAFVSDYCRVFVAVAPPTLSVERQLGHSFATPKLACDCLKVGLDFVSNHFQAVAWHFWRLERIA